MPSTKGTASSIDQLLANIVTWVTDPDIHGEDAWELLRNEPWPRGVIFKSKGSRGVNEAYIGIMAVKHVKGSSFLSWLTTTKNMLQYVIRNPLCFNLQTQQVLHTEGSKSFTVITNPSKGVQATDPTYTINGDVVNASCMALAFGVFKQYNEDLDWHEQPGGIQFKNNLQFFPIYYTSSLGSGTSYFQPPTYPGIGYPGFGINNSDLSGNFTYWLIKNVNSITVVINNNGNWDLGHAGMMEVPESSVQYGFPAVVCGSNTGLRGIQGVINGTYAYGDFIDYSIANTGLSRAMPCMPTANSNRTGEYVSQIAICSPDGTWVRPYNWTQKIDSYYYSGTGTLNFTPGAPVKKIRSGYCLTPTDNDLSNVTSFDSHIDVAHVSDDGTSGTVQRTQDENIALHRYTVYQADTQVTNVLGNFWNMYFPSHQGPSGELVIDGKKYLLLQNCWDGRLLYQPYQNFLSEIDWRYTKGNVNNIDARIQQVKDIYDDISAKYAAIQKVRQDIIDFNKQFRILIELEV